MCSDSWPSRIDEQKAAKIDSRASGFSRYLRVLSGELDCCVCGHWSRGPSAVSRRIDQYEWYCRGCGARLRRSARFLITSLSLLIVPTIAISLTILAYPSLIWFSGSAVTMVAVIIGCILIGELMAGWLLISLFRLKTTEVTESTGFCLHCQYDLRHADHQRCPECGNDCTETVVLYRMWQSRNASEDELP